LLKKILGLALIVVMALSLFAGCKKEQNYSLKLSTVLADTDPITLGLEAMAKEIKEKTKEKITVEVFPSSQLGDTADVLEQAKNGSNVGVIIDTGMLADYVPNMAIYTAPYIFDDVKEARSFITTDIFAAWDQELATHGLRDLSCNWYQGARHFCSNKPINTPSDLKGLRVRTMGSKVAQESMTAMGATPTSLAWSEAYSGLQQKVIDAVEAQMTAVYGASLHEVIKYVSETGHFLLYTALVISEDWYKSLPEEYQKIVVQASINAGDYATKLTQEKEVEYKEKMKEAGVTFIPVDKTPFKEAASSVYKTMGWTDLKAKIDAALGK
jgi:tripartite ATP-independent transporter DctP family solute receptor